MSNSVLGYDRVGSGEPLVLLHGFGSTRDDFAALIPALGRDFEVFAIDLPGHGESAMIDGRFWPPERDSPSPSRSSGDSASLSAS